jgi:hypothetical protein
MAQQFEHNPYQLENGEIVNLEWAACHPAQPFFEYSYQCSK